MIDILLKSIGAVVVLLIAVSFLGSVLPVRPTLNSNSHLSNLTNYSDKGKISGAWWGLWEVPQYYYSGNYLLYPMQDAYVNHIELKTSVPVIAMVTTLGTLIHLNGGMPSLTTNHTDAYYGNNINFWFNLSVGCSDYVLVAFTQNYTGFRVYPNVTTFTNNSYHIPFAANLTGVCKSYTNLTAKQ